MPCSWIPRCSLDFQGNHHLQHLKHNHPLILHKIHAQRHYENVKIKNCVVVLVRYICYSNPRNILIDCLIPSKHGAPTWYGQAATSVNHTDTDSSTEY